MSIKKILIIVTLLLFFNPITAQSVIYGHAYDGIGNILPDSEINLSDSRQVLTTHADNEGRFEFKNVLEGSYTITLSAGNYTESKTIIVKEKDTKVILYLEEMNSDQVLDDMVIQVESVKSRIEKEGFAVNVIETEQAALRNIQTNELLDRSVGVRVRQNGGLGSAVNYNLNGMSGNSVKIFIDGIPISTYGPSFNLNSIPPALIERIEVYKGVVPIHLSDDALGGVINVILKKGMQNTFNISSSYGSFNTSQTNFSGIVRDEKSGFTVKTSGFYNYSDNDYKIWGKFAYNYLADGSKEFVRTKRFNDTFRSYGGRVEAGFTNVKWADQFFIGYNGSDSYNEIQHGLFMAVPYKGRFTEANSHVFNLDYHKKDLLLKGLDLNLNATIGTRSEITNDTVKWRYNWHGEIAKGLYGEDLKTTSGAQQGSPTLNTINRNSINIRVGLSYQLSYNHRIILNQISTDINRTQTDLFKTSAQRDYEELRDLQKNITSLGYEMRSFDNKLKTNTFIKFYHQKVHKTDPVPEKAADGTTVRVENHESNNYNITGYGLAASYLVTPASVLLFSAEKAVRLPTDDEVFGRPGENLIGSISLRPEISDNYNLGLKLGPYKVFEKHKLALSGSGFIRDTKDKLVQQVNTRINEAQGATPLENLGKTRAIGFEAELHYVYNNNLNLLFNMSKFNSLYYLKHDSEGRLISHRYKEQLPNEPFFTINASAQYMLKNIFQKESVVNLYYNFGFVDSFYTIWAMAPGISNKEEELENAKTPRQFIQDLGISYVFPNKQFVISFDAKNIFNSQAYDNFAVQKPGRAFYVKLNYSFNKF